MENQDASLKTLLSTKEIADNLHKAYRRIQVAIEQKKLAEDSNIKSLTP